MQLHCSLDEICDKAPGITVSIFANGMTWIEKWNEVGNLEMFDVF